MNFALFLLLNAVATDSPGRTLPGHRRAAPVSDRHRLVHNYELAETHRAFVSVIVAHSTGRSLRSSLLRVHNRFTVRSRASWGGLLRVRARIRQGRSLLLPSRSGLGHSSAVPRFHGSPCRARRCTDRDRSCEPQWAGSLRQHQARRTARDRPRYGRGILARAAGEHRDLQRSQRPLPDPRHGNLELYLSRGYRLSRDPSEALLASAYSILRLCVA